MIRLSPACWPLRLRVALAFLAATALALTALGVFVHLRVSATLEERLRETLDFEANRLEAVPAEDRTAAVRSLDGDLYAQSLTPEGSIRASSRLVAAPLLGHRPGDATGYRDATITVNDDDAAAQGEQELEQEASILLVRHTDDGHLVVGTSREDTDEALAQVRGQLLVGGPLALALAGGLGYAVAGAGLRPIERMRARAATISDRSAGERLPMPPAEDELRRLTVTLNAMLDRLDEGLQRERRFMAEASHELRTPLSLLLTEIELALSRPRSQAEHAAALQSLHEEVRRLITLAEELLERVRAPDGGLPLVVRPVELVGLVTRVVDRFRPAAGKRELRVVAPGPVMVRGDASRLDRAVSNLVDNALRHGAGGIEIEIGAARGAALLTVTDEGDGFAHDSGPGGAGTGLGLTIVEEIARAHGGSIEVQRGNERTHVRVKLALSSH